MRISMIRINCIYNDQGFWCTNKQIKRSLFGLGSRMCIEADYMIPKTCALKQAHQAGNSHWDSTKE